MTINILCFEIYSKENLRSKLEPLKFLARNKSINFFFDIF
jgi:hypothetical protein